MATTKKHADIVIFTEHVAREMDIATALKFLVQKHYGLHVVVRSIVHGLMETLNEFEMPRVVVVPYAYSSLNDGINQALAAWPKSIYINLHFEQFFDKVSSFVCGPVDEFAKHRVMHLAWGNFFVEFLAAHGTQWDGIILNGNPALALYQEPYRRFYDDRETLAARHGLDPAKRWLFMPESYSMAFVEDAILDSMRDAGASESEVHVSRKQSRVAAVEVARWLHFAAQKTDVEIIVRPHPVVPLSEFLGLFIDAVGPVPQQLHFIKEGTVREWILASDAVAASFSTTMIDSAVAQKPTYLLRPIPFADYTDYAWHRLVPKVHTLTEFMQVAMGRGETDTWRPLHQWATETMLSQGDVIANLAHIIGAAYKGDERFPARVRKGGDPTTETPLQTEGHSRLNPAQATSKHEMDKYTDGDVNERVARWEQVLAA